MGGPLSSIKKKIGAQFGNRNAAKDYVKKGATIGAGVGALSGGIGNTYSALEFRKLALKANKPKIAQAVAKKIPKLALASTVLGAVSGAAQGSLIGFGAKKFKERKK